MITYLTYMWPKLIIILLVAIVVGLGEVRAYRDGVKDSHTFWKGK